MLAEIGSMNVSVESGTVLNRVQIEKDSEGSVTIKALLPKALVGGIDVNALDEITVKIEAIASKKVKTTQEGDVVIKLTTPYDVAYITDEYQGLLVSSHCAIIRGLNPEEINAKYLAYVLSSPYGKDYLGSVTTGASTAMLKVRDIISIPIPMLPLQEQEMLGDIFLAFCKKRAALKEMLSNEEAVQSAMIMDAIRREV